MGNNFNNNNEYVHRMAENYIQVYGRFYKAYLESTAELNKIYISYWNDIKQIMNNHRKMGESAIGGSSSGSSVESNIKVE